MDLDDQSVSCGSDRVVVGVVLPVRVSVFVRRLVTTFRPAAGGRCLLISLWD